MTLEELKIRQLTNQYLISPGEKLTIARDLCGVQAQFLSNARHALKIRCSDFDDAVFGSGLVKNWTLRGTVHVFPEADLPLYLTCNGGADYRKNTWEEPSFWNRREDWELSPQRQAVLSHVILLALEQGPMSREALKEACRNAGMTPGEEGSMFHPWGGGIRQLCERGFLNYLVQAERTFALAPDFVPLPEPAAQLELARRYFANYGPATIHDAMYFFRVSGKQVKQWLSQLPVSSCEYGGRTYYFIENGKRYDREIPRCLFLAGFDPLLLGYEKKESLYLKPEHLLGIFNLAGIVMPALLLDGDVAGKWRMKNGILTVDSFRNLSREELSLVTGAANARWPGMKKIQIL